MTGYSVTVMIDLENLPENWEELIKKIGLLKRHCFASIFEKYFDYQEKISVSQEDTSKLQQKAIIQYRDQEIMLVSIVNFIIFFFIHQK